MSKIPYPEYVVEPGTLMEIDGKIVTPDERTLPPLHYRIDQALFRVFAKLYWRVCSTSVPNNES